MKYTKDIFGLVVIMIGVVLFLPVIAAGLFLFRYLLLALIPMAIAFYLISPKLRHWVAKASENLSVNGFILADHLYYHSRHSWIEVLAFQKTKIGVDDFAQKLLGPVSEVRFAKVGQRIEVGDEIASLKNQGRVLSVSSPVSGVVQSINESLLCVPEMINKEPYRYGWLVRLKTTGLRNRLKELFSGSQAAHWLRLEGDRLRDVLANRQLVAVQSQDGGTFVDDIDQHIDDQAWKKITKDFF